jgi:NADH-quinone oxidoreductase subunit L
LKNIYGILSFIALSAPLASFVTVGLIASTRRHLIAVTSICWLTITFVSAAVLYFTLDTDLFVIRADWFWVGKHTFSADLALSNQSLLMLVVVAVVSLLVHIYSTVYMMGDEDWKRYFAVLGLFTFSMQGIVLTDNLLFLFIFWELVGFSSYLLIGHWTKKPEAGRAASKAFIMNRIGDAGFLVGLMIIWTSYGTFSLSTILGSDLQSGWDTAAAICVFGGVIGKSAQFPLFPWLPDAMEGPTPVSALIHAATMVAAGVYLLVRIFDLFTSEALVVVAVTGMITTVMGALAALSQYDIKKILAYSTMSQLGLMILAIGMGVADAALLHLITHAFFKACLFLSAGMIIHSLHEAQPAHLYFDVQDIRNMGGLRKRMPITFITCLISGASLAGVPFFSGFLSKEAILTALFLHANIFSWLMIAVILGVSFLTVLYTFRMIWFVFFGGERSIRTLAIAEPGLLMRIPVIILAACSLWVLVSWNPFHFEGWIFQPRETPAYALWITVLSVMWVIAALVVSWFLFRKGTFRTSTLLRNSFYVDKAYNLLTATTIRRSNLAVSVVERNVIDRGIHAVVYCQVIFAHMVGWIDRVFVDGTVNATARLTGFGGKISRSFQGGNVQLYIFWSLFALIIFIIWALK